MADNSYDTQAKVYMKQGGDEQVIASGGAQTIESGGEIEVKSGGILDLQAGALVYFDSTAQDMTELKYTLLSLNTRTTPWGESGTGISGASVLAPGYGYHVFSLTTGLSLGTKQLPQAYAGVRLYIDCSGLVNDGNVILYGSATAGVSVAVINTASTLLSSINCSAAAKLTLVCFDTGTWAIVEHNASATPRPIA